MPRLPFTAIAALAIASLAPQFAAGQAPYPSREIKVIVGFSPGSGPDITARRVAEAIRRRSGQTVIVENKPGALTNIAAQSVAMAKPDGYTVFVTAGNSTFGINPWLFKNLPYDPVKDFTPVTSLFRTPFAFAVTQGSPINSVAELTGVLKSKGARGKYAYANSISMIGAEVYKYKAGLESVGVSYKSIVDSHAALAAGEVDFFLADMTFKSRAKILALTIAERSPLMPDTPSAKEAGLVDYDVGAWWAVWLPANAPKDIVDKLAGWIEAGVDGEDSRTYYTSIGAQPWLGVRGDELRQYMIDDIRKWGEMAKVAKIEPQ